MSTQTDITGFFHMKKSKLSSSKQIAKAINADSGNFDTNTLSNKSKETERKVPLCERKRARSPALPSQNKRFRSHKKTVVPAPKANTIYKAFEKRQLQPKDTDETSPSITSSGTEVAVKLGTLDAPVKVAETIQRKGKSSQETPALKELAEEDEDPKSSAKKRLDMSPSFHLNQKLQQSPTRGALMLQRAAVKMGQPVLKENPVKNCSAVRNLFNSSSETKPTSTLAEKLERSGKRKELLASLKKAGTSFQQLKKFREDENKPQLSKFEALSFEVVSPKKTPASPLKSPRKVPGSLALPFKYKFLQELFYGLDTVVSMLHNRKETITWEKVKPAVQEMTRRNFLEKHLGQIWKVYPNGYEILQEKAVARQFQKNSSKYNLTIHPSLSLKDNESAGATKYVQMDPKIMLQRRSIFHRNLVQKVKNYHREFLSTLDPPVVIDDDQLTHWHHEFELNKVEDIQATPLPTPPTEETFNTAKDVLEKACINHPLMEEALRKRTQETEKKDGGVQEQKTEVDKTKVPEALRGINPSLLAKIREKEAARVQRELTRGPKEDRRREQLSRLPQVARIVRGIYVAEKKPAILWSSVVDKLTHSHPTLMSNAETEEHLSMLIKEVPVWLTVHNLSSGRYLKINKSVDVNSVVSKLEKLLRA